MEKLLICNEPSYLLTPPALFVTLVPGREAGSFRAETASPLRVEKATSEAWKGPSDTSEGLRGPLRSRGVEPVEPPPKHSSACSPAPRKGRGSPSANWYYQGVHHSEAIHTKEEHMSMCSYVYALVQSRKHSRSGTLETPSSANDSNLRVKPLPVHLPGIEKQST
ncbi:hypothetical protein GOODEAATRI_009862 [Goodea atripinnis]|uniref:Uncharacterized protein n=1 Tax=Goodea atripinnis TaxID=208336 RepID=A0ABV0PWQ8_9TELE